jgi:predicted  nucleic acid-binding Zn-ribbon protein
VDQHLQTLSDLQQRDSRIAALDAEAARLPREVAAIEAALAEAKKSLDVLRVRQDKARKDLRAKEQDLEVASTKRAKSETRLYEVKTNKEYSAVLVEIDEIKQEKGEIEEQILGLMEVGERVAVEIREAEQLHALREEQARHNVAEVGKRLAAVEAELRDAYFARLLGRPLKVLVETPLGGERYVGTSCRYAPVELEASPDEVGRFVSVVGDAVRGGRILATTSAPLPRRG